MQQRYRYNICIILLLIGGGSLSLLCVVGRSCVADMSFPGLDIPIFSAESKVLRTLGAYYVYVPYTRGSNLIFSHRSLDGVYLCKTYKRLDVDFIGEKQIQTHDPFNN